MRQTHDALPEFVRDLSAIAVALLSPEGSLVEANAGFRALLDAPSSAGTVPPLTPAPAELLSRPPADGDGVLYRGPLRFGYGSAARSASGAVYRHPAGLLVVAEPGLAGLTEELAETQRQRDRGAADLRGQISLTDAIADNLGEGVCAADRAGRVTFFNRAAEALLGRGRELVLGRQLPELFAGAGDGAVVSILATDLQEVLRTRTTKRRSEITLTDAGGKRFPAGYSLAPILRDGDLLGAVLVFFDLSALKRAEEAEREAEASTALADRLRRELDLLSALAGAETTDVTARLFGARPLREAVPEVFAGLVGRYAATMERALEQRGYRVDYDLTEELRALADSLGFLRAGPRDVIDLHGQAVAARQKAAPRRLRAYLEEGRLLVLELMGHLASYYRKLAPPAARPGVPPPPPPPDAGGKEHPDG